MTTGWWKKLCSLLMKLTTIWIILMKSLKCVPGKECDMIPIQQSVQFIIWGGRRQSSILVPSKLANWKQKARPFLFPYWPSNFPLLYPEWNVVGWKPLRVHDMYKKLYNSTKTKVERKPRGRLRNHRGNRRFAHVFTQDTPSKLFQRIWPYKSNYKLGNPTLCFMAMKE